VLNLDPAKLLIIAVVAVILLGPDKLPQVARQAGAAWRTFNEFRHRMESEVRSSIPDLPSSADIARLARSPSALLNHLSTLPADGAAKDEAAANGAAKDGAAANGAAKDGAAANGAAANGAAANGAAADGNGTSADPSGAESHREQAATETSAATPTMPSAPISSTPPMPSTPPATAPIASPAPGSGAAGAAGVAGVAGVAGAAGDPSLN